MGLRGNPRTAWGEIPVARPARATGSRSGQRPTQPLRGKVTMTDKKNTGPQEGVKGVVEDVKGKAKQDKADAQRDVAKKEAQADSARAGAKAAEKRQEAEQRP